MTLRPGLLDDKYEILQKLGEGGMGTVYKVRHLLLDDVRVIKVIRQQPSQDEAVVLRFREEARTAIRLRHPGIAQLLDFSVADDGTAVIVMEFIDGVTLFEILKKAGPPELGLTIEMALQALDALAYLHEEGYVHRDISPDNLMLTRGRDGRPVIKLIDLGLAKNLDSSLKLTATGTFLGKVRYSAPEQFGDEGVDARSDIYSFGVMFYELLTGVLPISGEQFSELVGGHLVRPPRDFTETDPEGRVPSELRSVVLQTLEKVPARRIASASELARRLEPFKQPFQSPFEGDVNLITPLGLRPSPLDTEAHGDGVDPTSAVPPSQLPPSQLPPSAVPPSAALPSAAPPSEPTPSGPSEAPRSTPPAPATVVTVRTGKPVSPKRDVRPAPAPVQVDEPVPASDTVASPRRRRMWVAAALVVLLVLGGMGLVRLLEPRPGVEEFRAAMLAYRSEDWTTAAKRLRDAIDLDPRERARLVKIAPGVEEPYLPHYFLGRVYQKKSNPVTASKSLNQSKAQGIVQQFEHYRQDLEQRIRDLADAAIRGAESELRLTQDHVENLRTVLDGEDYGWFRDNRPTVASAARELLTRFIEAEGELELARRGDDYRAASEAGTKIRNLRQQMVDLLLGIDDLLDQVP